MFLAPSLTTLKIRCLEIFMLMHNPFGCPPPQPTGLHNTCTLSYSQEENQTHNVHLFVVVLNC